MNKEIGSEFWDIPITEKDNGFFNDATWFVSGRAAFRAILQQIKIQLGDFYPVKVALPSYLCESMILPLEKEGVRYKFYRVEFKNKVFQFDYSNVADCNVILLIDYFGYESISNCFHDTDKIIVRDLTHSFFTKAYNDADYYFGSLRKWAGFKCGGFAFRKNGGMLQPTETAGDYIILRHDAMNLKKKYINGEIDDKEYLKFFAEAEHLLDECTISHNILDDINAAKHFDAKTVKTIRRRNAQVLIDGLRDFCLIGSLSKNDCPLFVPILYKNRDKLRKCLIEKEIYCPIHWPKPFKEASVSDLLYEQELSLVCDQRYSAEDMKRIVVTVKEFIKNDKNENA